MAERIARLDGQLARGGDPDLLAGRDEAPGDRAFDELIHEVVEHLDRILPPERGRGGTEHVALAAERLELEAQAGDLVHALPKEHGGATVEGERLGDQQGLRFDRGRATDAAQ